MGKEKVTDIIFKDNKIQKGYRVKIPKAIVDTLDLKEGQGVFVKFDVDLKKFVVELEEKKKRPGGIKK